MHRSIIQASILAATLCGGTTAFAGELARQSIPQVWIDQYTPEKLPELKFPAYFDELDKARALAFAGRYKTALLELRKVTKGDPAEIAMVKGSALSAVGRGDEALACLSDPAVRDNPRVQVLRARILSNLGKYADAIAILRSNVEKNPKSVPGRYYLGEISEKAGDIETAKQQYESIYKTYYDQWQGQGADAFEDAEQVTLMGRAFDRHATLAGMYASNPGLPKVMLRVFVRAYDVVDRGYWPAHVAAAEYFMAHGNSPEAGKELMAALAMNPNDARSHVLAGMIALEQFNFDAADREIARIRAVDNDSPDADILETRSLLQQRRPADAEAAVERVLAKQPRNIEALGLLAGAYALQLKEDKVKETLATVEKIDPHNSSAYVELAEVLSSMRQYPRSEQAYQTAIQRAPWSIEARNGLGLLLTQSGDEDGAKKALDAAYALDPYNYRTTNYLILLDKMAKMARRESEHFVVLYDPKNDPIIPEYFTDYLESMYKSVCEDYHHEPKEKTYIEVFPSHDEFSARITGAPWIGTVGASTGRVIALSSPRRGDGPMMSPYNWAQVLRHEYTHTVTLSATENRIAHWLTEGLAVSEEGVPMRWEWAPMLYDAVTKKTLFTMDNLTWAFVRPKRPQDRPLAYAESYWICQYITQKWGHDKLLKMMDEFKQGRSESDVFKDLLGMTTAQFDKDFFAWAEKQVAGWGFDKETTKKYDELVKKAEEQRDKDDLAGAIDTWEQIVKMRPVDALPHLRLAGFYLAQNSPAKALEHLKILHRAALKDDRFAKRIARLYVNLKDLKNAEKYALEAIYIDPYDLDAHELLMSIQEKTGNTAGVDREKRVIPELKTWIKDYRKSTGTDDQ